MKAKPILRLLSLLFFLGIIAFSIIFLAVNNSREQLPVQQENLFLFEPTAQAGSTTTKTPAMGSYTPLTERFSATYMRTKPARQQTLVVFDPTTRAGSTTAGNLAMESSTAPTEIFSETDIGTTPGPTISKYEGNKKLTVTKQPIITTTEAPEQFNNASGCGNTLDSGRLKEFIGYFENPQNTTAEDIENPEENGGFLKVMLETTAFDLDNLNNTDHAFPTNCHFESALAHIDCTGGHNNMTNREEFEKQDDKCLLKSTIKFGECLCQERGLNCCKGLKDSEMVVCKILEGNNECCEDKAKEIYGSCG